MPRAFLSISASSVCVHVAGKGQHLATAQPMRLTVDDSTTDARDADEAVEATIDASFARQADLYAQQVQLPCPPYDRIDLFV